MALLVQVTYQGSLENLIHKAVKRQTCSRVRADTNSSLHTRPPHSTTVERDGSSTSHTPHILRSEPHFSEPRVRTYHFYNVYMCVYDPSVREPGPKLTDNRSKMQRKKYNHHHQARGHRA